MENMRLIKAIKLPESKTLNVWVRYDYVEEDDTYISNDTLEYLARSEGNLDDIQKEMDRKGHSTKGLKDVVRVLVNRGDIYLHNNRIWKRNLR